MTKTRNKPSVAIVGGGITSSMLALNLIEDGYNVTVVEKANTGNGASSRSAAAIRAQFTNETTVRGMVWAKKYFQRFSPRYGCETVFRQNGYLFLHNDVDSFASAKEQVLDQQSWGLEEVTTLSPSEIKAGFPYVSVDEVVGATWCPTDGFLQPHILLSRAFEEVDRRGGRILQNAKVTSVERTTSAITGLVTTKGTVKADIYVNTTGIWSSQFCKTLGIKQLEIDLNKVFLYFLDSSISVYGDAPLSKEVADRPMIVSPNGAYCRPDWTSNRLMMGALTECPVAHNFPDEEQDIILPKYTLSTSSGRSVNDTSYGFEVWQEMSKWLPDISLMKPAGQSSGIYDNTPDHTPFIDFDPQISNLIHAVGFSGHGMMHSPFTAVVIRHLIDTGAQAWTMELDDQVIDISSFSITREYNPEGKVI